MNTKPRNPKTVKMQQNEVEINLGSLHLESVPPSRPFN